MNKNKEKLGLDDLLAHMEGWSLVPRCREESPDFVIMNERTKMKVGVEVTDYYPHRSYRGNALVQISGRDVFENEYNKFRYFEESSLGHFRFVPQLDNNDLYESRIADKESKLGFYKANEPECIEFWLLIMLSFYDSIEYRNNQPLKTTFDKVYIWEEPHSVYELPICH